MEISKLAQEERVSCQVVTHNDDNKTGPTLGPDHGVSDRLRHLNTGLSGREEVHSETANGLLLSNPMSGGIAVQILN